MQKVYNKDIKHLFKMHIGKNSDIRKIIYFKKVRKKIYGRMRIYMLMK